jgi:predicted nucleic acid-binding protein
MIVIDANILIYALIECDNSRLIPQLRAKDADWRTTELCQHEALNVLVTYQRRGVLTLEQCRVLLKHARRFITDAQHEVDMEASLTAAAKYGITGYDAQYVALAESLSVPLITEDRKLCQAVPGIGISMQEFIEHT